MRTCFDPAPLGRCLPWCLLVVVIGVPLLVKGQTNIVTYHYDNGCTGQNTNETILTPGNLNPASFGWLFRLSVDGLVWAQPLYVSNVIIPGLGTHNVLYVVTSHDSVYAFDPDNGAQLWSVRFLINGATPGDGYANDIAEAGITATPVLG